MAGLAEAATWRHNGQLAVEAESVGSAVPAVPAVSEVLAALEELAVPEELAAPEE
jgi:hypothetical protein